MKFFVAALLLALCGCAQGAYQSDPQAAAIAAMPPPVYKLAPNDKVRVAVFSEPTLSGEFTISSDGKIAFPLIGELEAAGKSASELSALITSRLSDGFVREPSVTAEVLTFRPFYVLGEVNRAGEFPFTPGMSVPQAIASAQGFTYRANQNFVFLTRAGSAEEVRVPITPSLKIYPGDTIRAVERYF